MATQQELLEKCQACENLSARKAECTCAGTDCPLHGLCCACIEWHRDHAPKSGVPSCLRDKVKPAD